MEFKVFERLWWATPVWECPVEDINNKSIAEYCYKVRDEKPGVNISNRGGWHSGELITPIPPELEQLFNELTVFVNDVPQRYMGTSNLVLGNWWVNINGKHDYNMPHDHQNSVLSGTYYVQVPEQDMGDLVLHRGDTAEFDDLCSGKGSCCAVPVVKHCFSQWTAFPWKPLSLRSLLTSLNRIV